ncbi:MAG: leucine-rich repeat domain-containing protein [Parvibaculum sp.]
MGKEYLSREMEDGLGVRLFDGEVGFARKVFKKRQFEYIDISTGEWPDLDFLDDQSHSLKWITAKTPKINWKRLVTIEGLQWLTLDCKPPRALSLDRLPNLRVLEMKAGGRLVVDGSPCESLLDLSYNNLTSRDLGLLSMFPSLKHLSLRRAQSIEDLSGIGECQDLRGLYLQACRKLNAIGDDVPSSLVQLGIHSCLSLRDLSGLRRATEMRQLELTGSGEIESLGFAASMKKLEYLCVEEKVRVRDKDVAFLREIASLKHAAYHGDLRPSADEMPNAFRSGERLYDFIPCARHLPSKAGILSDPTYD